MKKLKAVEQTRKEYHRDKDMYSVHRSSLLVPELAGAKAEISFVNHFLLKRNYPHVTCKISKIGEGGRLLGSRMYPVTEPKVYRFLLTDDTADKVSTYQVEFFSADNLFIPYPAVMVNHYGPGFFNSVHAYNRLLNDVFENDAINQTQVKEASIDVRIDAAHDTFLIFTAGQQPCTSQLSVELATPERQYQKNIPLDVPRFGNKKMSLKNIFNISSLRGGVLKIKQPEQFLFYGRMLVGQEVGGAFAANHSYYDCSAIEEYWDNATPSKRVFPYFQGVRHGIRAYPIFSPGTLEWFATPYDNKGALAAPIALGALTSPGNDWLDIALEDVLAANNVPLERLVSYEITARPKAGQHIPTRIALQVIYGDSGHLQASINVALNSENIFQPPGKKHFLWGQIPVMPEVESWLGITSGSVTGNQPPAAFVIRFYGENGACGEIPGALAHGGDTFRVHIPSALKNAIGDSRYLWYMISADTPLNGYTVTRHRESGHVSGEHSF